MRILLTGRTGQVGFELQRALAPLGDVTAVDRTSCNLEDADAVRHTIRTVQPDVIVNPAAYTAVDKAETDRDRATAVNARAPAVIGEEACPLGALVVHYSTDYVFDGTAAGFYTETDPTNPQGVYGATKLAGERALKESGARHIILRTSWVFGSYGSNFAKTMIRLARERTQLSIVADQVGAPTSAALIADISAHIIHQIRKTSSPDQEGTFHLAAGGEATWFDYARHVIRKAQAAGIALKVDPEAIEPIATEVYPTPARRPKNSRLNTEKLRQTFDLRLPQWETGLDLVLRQILQEAV